MKNEELKMQRMKGQELVSLLILINIMVKNGVFRACAALLGTKRIIIAIGKKGRCLIVEYTK